MKLRVLGCSGAIAKECRTTSFLLGKSILIDAGTGVGDLALADMKLIDHVFLTHSHLDHIASLPLMLDACASLRSKPMVVHALPQTIEALRKHVFNDVIWPDFSRIPSAESPFLTFQAIHIGETVSMGALAIEVLPAVHTVPACGFAVTAGSGCWVFSGDTERNPEFWKRINELNVSALVIETAFSDREKELAKRALHLAPATLASELDHIDVDKHFPIYITHTKPAETEMIMAEIQRFDDTDIFASGVRHDIRGLRIGQEFEV